MPKQTLLSPRRAPRFATVAKPEFFLPIRCTPPASSIARAGFHTYYLSCDVRGLALYLPHAIKHVQKGFRATILAPAGLQFEPPTVALLGLQDGDVFDHGHRWVLSNPIDEIHLEAVARNAPINLKDQQRAQLRYADALSTLEGVAEAQTAAESELEAATADLIAVQGVESINIDGIYFDASYSREKVYLKRRDPRFNPQEADVEKPQKRGKKAGKRSRRAA